MMEALNQIIVLNQKLDAIIHNKKIEELNEIINLQQSYIEQLKTRLIQVDPEFAIMEIMNKK